MKNIFHIAFLLFVIGIFLVPMQTYACESHSTNTEKSCCKKKSSSHEKKDCCKNKQSDKKDTSCNGKCGHANCLISSIHISLISFQEIEFKNNIVYFSYEKSKFHSFKTVISSGFSSVWLPPKIK